MSRSSTAASTPLDKRRPAACQRCHKRKVKCSGGLPCRNCQTAGTVCTFPTRDRNVLVSEAYLHRLQAFAQSRMEADAAQPTASVISDGDASGLAPEQSTVHRKDSHETRAAPLTLRHATAEAFVSGLKRLSTRDSATSPEDTSHHPAIQLDTYSEASAEVSNYDYVSLNFDTSCEQVSIQLPPYPYVTQLVSQFEAFMGYEYHWYSRREFHQNLEATYRCPDSAKSRDRTWLCKVLAVLALGESFNSYEPPLIDLSRAGDEVHRVQVQDERGSYLPGVRFFEQALSLFKMPSEEPALEHVEALNLIAFFCYSLNRRKTAYMYAGMSARIASSLMLHVPAMTEAPVVAEHRKRVWWTTFLMDAMVSSEMGLRAAFGFAQAEHALPSDDQIPLIHRGDFWDSRIMTAHLKLCNIRSLILESVGQLHEADFAGYEKVIEVPLRELETWKRELPPEISFDFLAGVPPEMIALPSVRSLASCYLRYHQGHIMLIRPVFFKLLGIVLGKDTDMSTIDGLLNLASRCLEAAKCNLRILTALSSLNLLAKYGFYESLHLFSSIKIFSLSRLVNAIRPLSLIQEPQDIALYSTARDLLLSMATCGNLASRGHMRMLEDIERHLDVVPAGQGDGQAQGQELQMPNFGLNDISPWIDSIGDLDSFLDISGFPQMPDTL